MQQTTGDRKLLAHASRQLAWQRPAFLDELELVEQHGNARIDVGHAVDPRDEPKMFLDREIVEEMRLVWNERERSLCLDRLALNVVAGDRHRSAGRGDDAGEAPQRRRLAGAVRTDE